MRRNNGRVIRGYENYNHQESGISGYVRDHQSLSRVGDDSQREDFRNCEERCTPAVADSLWCCT